MNRFAEVTAFQLAILAFCFSEFTPAFARPVDLPSTVVNHPGPEACVGFMIGRWRAKRDGEEIFEEWSRVSNGDCVGKHQVSKDGKIVSTLTITVKSAKYGSLLEVSMTPADKNISFGSVQPIWGRGDERSFVTVIGFNTGKIFTYSQFDTEVLNLKIDNNGDVKAHADTIVFHKVAGGDKAKDKNLPMNFFEPTHQF